MRFASTLALCTSHVCLIAAVITAAKPKITHWEAINRFANASCYPGTLDIAQNFSKASEFFADNVNARIRGTANLVGFEDVVELIFGVKVYNLTAFSGPGSGSYYYASYTIRDYVEDNNKDVAYATIDYNMQPSALGVVIGVPASTYTTMSVTTTNSEGYIDQYDVVPPNFGLSAYSFPNLTVEQRKAGSITNMCGIHQTFCTGSKQQYANVTDCQTQLAAIPWGTDLVYNMNTVQCRSIYAGLIHFRPEVHCPNIGPSGGTRCLDSHTYPTFYTDTATVFSKPFLGDHK